MKLNYSKWGIVLSVFAAAAVVTAQTGATADQTKAAPKASSTKSGTKGAGTKAATKSGAAPAATETPAKTADPNKPPRENGLYATITTSMGPITARLFEKESPITVKNFVDLALGKKTYTIHTGEPSPTDPGKEKMITKRAPLYTGLIFHRVIPGFMIQGGDPMGSGRGGTNPIPDEFDPSLKFDVPGRLAMANAGPNTGSSQFFITEGVPAHLNGKHTIFGQVVEGQDVVNKIANVPRDAQDRPNTPVKIVKITFERVGPGPQPGAAAPAAKPGATKGTATKAGTKAAPKATTK